jgi:hypothetical protein
LTETLQIVKRRKRNNVTYLSTDRPVAARELEEEMPKGITSLVDSSSQLRRVSPLAQAVEILQQGVEATSAGTRMQVDAADFLDQLLQRL